MHWKRRKCANHNKFAPLVPVKHSAHVKNIAPSVRLKKRQANLGVSPFFHSALLQFDTEKRGATTPAALLSCSPATPSNSTDLFVGIDTTREWCGGEGGVCKPASGGHDGNTRHEVRFRCRPFFPALLA
jgi:hypothetical protein